MTCWESLPSILNPAWLRPLYELLRSDDPCKDPLTLQQPQDKPLTFKLTLLTKTATYLSDALCLVFPISPCSSCSRNQFLISSGKLQRVANQQPERSLKHKPVDKYWAQVSLTNTWSTTWASRPLPFFQFILLSLPWEAPMWLQEKPRRTAGFIISYTEKKRDSTLLQVTAFRLEFLWNSLLFLLFLYSLLIPHLVDFRAFMSKSD